MRQVRRVDLAHFADNRQRAHDDCDRALRLGASVEGALWASLAFVFGTIAFVDSRELLADPLLVFLTTVAIYCTLGAADTMNVLIATAMCGLAVLAKPTGVVLGPILAVFALLKRRRIGAAAAPLAGSLFGSVLYLFYNEYRFGDAARDWSASQAPLLTAWSASYRTVNAAFRPENNVKSILRRAGSYHARTDQMPSLQVIALWWWMLPAAGIRAWIGAILALTMVACGIALVARGLREARMQDALAEM